MYENRIMYEECLEVRVRVESLDQLTDTLEKIFYNFFMSIIGLHFQSVDEGNRTY